MICMSLKIKLKLARGIRVIFTLTPLGPLARQLGYASACTARRAAERR
jgi:hypothetical protein